MYSFFACKKGILSDHTLIILATPLWLLLSLSIIAFCLQTFDHTPAMFRIYWLCLVRLGISHGNKLQLGLDKFILRIRARNSSMICTAYHIKGKGKKTLDLICGHNQKTCNSRHSCHFSRVGKVSN